MLNCRQVTRLISQSMDAELAWHRRLAMRGHLLYCVWCRRYLSQLRLLRKAAKDFAAQELEASNQKLSPEAREQMRASLQEAIRRLPRPPQ